MQAKFITFTPTDERPEIGDGVQLIEERITSGEKTTSIIFSARFGKSDEIRAGATELRAKSGGASVVLVPWTFLARQMLNRKKVLKMQKRLKMQTFSASRLEPGNFDGHFFEEKPLCDLYVLTIAAACQAGNLEALKDAAILLRGRGEQLRVFIDESHSVTSKSNGAGWGEVAVELRDAGAHIVLLTATPLRSDNIAPFGFAVKELDRKHVEYRIPGVDDNNSPIFRIYAAEKVAYQLQSDLPEVTRKDAWDRGILTPIQVRWFGFTVNQEEVDKIDNDSMARRALSKAVRSDAVIVQAVMLMVEDVLIRRHTAPTSAAIVYVGNDNADEASDDRHTQRVKNIIERMWREQTGISPLITVAMLKESNADDAAAKIEQFVGDEDQPGIGDVLIVKQMGGVGLDADRIKTGVDLSIIRSISSCIQRWLRVCTRWDGPNGKRLASHATLILPKDCITEAIYDHVVTQQGGDFKGNESVELIDEVPREPDEKQLDLLINGPYNAGVTDQHLQSINADVDALVSKLLRQQPKLALIYDRLALAQLLANGQFSVVSDNNSEDDEPAPTYVNPDDEVVGLKAQINDLTKQLAEREWNLLTHKEEWIDCRRRYYNDARRASGANVRLPLLHDVELLQKQVKYLELVLKEHTTNSKVGV